VLGWFVFPKAASSDNSTELARTLKKLTEHTHIEFWSPDHQKLLPSSGFEQLTFQYHVGEVPSMDLGFTNAGEFSVLAGSHSGFSLVMIDKAKLNDPKNLESRLENPLVMQCGELLPLTRGDGYGIQHSCWATVTYETPLSETDVRALTQGEKVFCTVGKTIWDDGSGRYRTDLCRCQLVGNWRPCPSIDQRERPVEQVKQPS
jgi:hypothetical protein